MNARVTLKDVAQHAGVSYQTVSKVLRGQVQVTPVTRQRIEAVAAELGYRPNAAARSLRTQATNLIGYSFKPSLHNEPNPILEAFLQTIIRSAEQHQYHIMLFPWWGEENKLVETYEELITTNRVDGFVLSDVDFDDPRIPVLRRLDFPFVAFGRSQPEPDYAYVDVDGRAGIRKVVEYFIEAGHTKIAVLAWPESSRVGVSRLNGFYDAMNNANLPVDPEWVRRGEGTAESAYALTTSLLDLPPDRRPTAIVTLVDLMAIGALYAINEKGLSVGRDVCISGFDDTQLGRYVRPAITTVRQPIEEVGQRTIELLINIIQGNQPVEDKFLLQPELVVRESSKRPT